MCSISSIRDSAQIPQENSQVFLRHEDDIHRGNAILKSNYYVKKRKKLTVFEDFSVLFKLNIKITFCSNRIILMTLVIPKEHLESLLRLKISYILAYLLFMYVVKIVFVSTLSTLEIFSSKLQIL